MSYGASPALQAAVYQALIGDAGLAALVGTAIYDAIPSGSLPATYVAIGPEAAYDKSDKSGGSAEHVFTVSVVTDSAGFQAAKDVAAQISDVLIDAPLTLTRGTLIYLNFDRASATREGTGATRRIDLRFRALVQDT